MPVVSSRDRSRPTTGFACAKPRQQELLDRLRATWLLEPPADGFALHDQKGRKSDYAKPLGDLRAFLLCDSMQLECVVVVPALQDLRQVALCSAAWPGTQGVEEQKLRLLARGVMCRREDISGSHCRSPSRLSRARDPRPRHALHRRTFRRSRSRCLGRRPARVAGCRVADRSESG
jgi:hypothetical protein